MVSKNYTNYTIKDVICFIEMEGRGDTILLSFKITKRLRATLERRGYILEQRPDSIFIHVKKEIAQ